jgi:hypothetical protein
MCADLRGSVRAPAEDPDVVDRGGPAQRQRPHVVELEMARAAADLAIRQLPLAAAAVAPPDLAADMSRDVLGLRRPGLLPRPLDEAPALRDLRQHEIEPRLEQLLVGRVRPRGPGLLELLREPLGDGDVQAAQLRGERDALGRSRSRSRAR